MDDTVLQNAKKVNHLEERIINSKESPRYLSQFKIQLNQIKSAQFAIPKKQIQHKSENHIPAVKVEHQQINVSKRSPSPNFEEIAQLKDQLKLKDLQRQELVDEFQIKHSNLILQLNEFQKAQLQYENGERTLLSEIDYLKQVNEELSQVNNQLNTEINDFRKDSVEKFIELKLKLSKKDTLIGEYEREIKILKELRISEVEIQKKEPEHEHREDEKEADEEESKIESKERDIQSEEVGDLESEEVMGIEMSETEVLVAENNSNVDNLVEESNNADTEDLLHSSSHLKEKSVAENCDLGSSSPIQNHSLNLSDNTTKLLHENHLDGTTTRLIKGTYDPSSP